MLLSGAATARVPSASSMLLRVPGSLVDHPKREIDLGTGEQTDDVRFIRLWANSQTGEVSSYPSLYALVPELACFDPSSGCPFAESILHTRV